MSFLKRILYVGNLPWLVFGSKFGALIGSWRVARSVVYSNAMNGCI